MPLLLDEDGPVACLEEVANAPVHAIEAPAIQPIQLPHAEREVGARRLNEQVIVIAHQAVAVAKEAVALDDLGQDHKEALVVVGAEEDVLAIVAARRDVVEGARELETQRTTDLASVGRDGARPQSAVRDVAYASHASLQDLTPEGQPGAVPLSAYRCFLKKSTIVS
jgi:hypothetical protein